MDQVPREELLNSCRAEVLVKDIQKGGKGLSLNRRTQDGRRIDSIRYGHLVGKKYLVWKSDDGTYLAVPAEAEKGKNLTLRRYLSVPMNIPECDEYSCGTGGPKFGEFELAGKTVQIGPRNISYRKIDDKEHVFVTILGMQFVCPIPYNTLVGRGGKSMPLVFERDLTARDPSEIAGEYALDRRVANFEREVFKEMRREGSSVPKHRSVKGLDLLGSGSGVVKQKVQLSDFLDEAIRASRSGVVVIDISAADCGPCRKVAPYYEAAARCLVDQKSSSSLYQINFKSSDLDGDGFDPDAYLLLIAHKLLPTGVLGLKVENISEFPTFLYLKDGEVFDFKNGAREFAVKGKDTKGRAIRYWSSSSFVRNVLGIESKHDGRR